MERVVVEGLEIAFERAGTGPPLVLLHGGLSDHREWSRQLDALSDELTVVAWDAPGTGQSADPPDGFLATDYSRVLAGFIGALGLRSPHLLGLSAGSWFAFELYRSHPHLPASLILASAYAGWAGSLPPGEAQRRLHQVLADLDRPPDTWVGGLLPTMLSPSAAPELAEELVQIMSAFHPAGSRVMVRAFAEADYRDVLPRIDVPTLLLHGERDVRSPLPVAQALADQIPRAELVVLRGAGHMCNLEDPDGFNAAVRSFVRAGPRTAAR